MGTTHRVPHARFLVVNMPKDCALLSSYDFVSHALVIFIQCEPPLLHDTRDVLPELERGAQCAIQTFLQLHVDDNWFATLSAEVWLVFLLVDFIKQGCHFGAKPDVNNFVVIILFSLQERPRDIDSGDVAAFIRTNLQ
jgi:hypothetical protein